MVKDKKDSSTSSFATIKQTFLATTTKIVVGVIIGLILAWVGIDKILEGPVRRRELAKKFEIATEHYVAYAKRSWLDVDQHGYHDDNKSDIMKDWEGPLWLRFKDVLRDAERECSSSETILAIKRLRCANRKYYSLYEVQEENQPLSEVIDFRRLEEDCGTVEWSLLQTQVLPGSPELDPIFSNLFDELSASQVRAAELVNECGGL